MRNETQRNEIYLNAKRNENILKSNKNNINGTRSDEKVEAEFYTDMHV